MKILSLFDGMSCGYIAMLMEGVAIDRYVAYEIDKYAVETSKHNFPGIEHKGDVFKGDFTEYRGFDWLVGGSPCTYWSIAQKNNRETEASGLGWELFSQYVRALREAQPKWFLYENNKSMSSAIRESISKEFGFEPVFINSALVSAQNRQRLYWVGRRNEDGTYSKVDVPLPEDRGILLKDILETGAEPVNTTVDGKSQTIKSQYAKNNETNFCCYTSTYGASGAAESVCVAQRGRYAGSGNRTVKGNGPVEQYYEARVDGKSNALTTVQKDNGVAEPVGTTKDGKSYALTSSYYKCGENPFSEFGEEKRRPRAVEPVRVRVKEATKLGYATPCEWDADGKPVKAVSCADGKVYKVYEVKDGQIVINGKQYGIKLVDGFYIIRKLTVRECMRLQTVPEWFEFPVSDTQAYKMLGNGWTVEVIRHLINCALEGDSEDYDG